MAELISWCSLCKAGNVLLALNKNVRMGKKAIMQLQLAPYFPSKLAISLPAFVGA